jgi:acyl-CoA dehydrogenase
VSPVTCFFHASVTDAGTGIPADQIFQAQLDSAKTRWSEHPQIIEELKVKAKKLGLWNMFLPKAHFHKLSPGFSNLEYGLMAEYLGKSVIASEVTNCAAPDTGNMEVLAKYGNPAQQEEWLKPLLDGKIRSAFLMTEPDIASSDATNIALQIKRDGDHYVLNGSVCPSASLRSSLTNTHPRNGGAAGLATTVVNSSSSWA